MAKRTYTTVMDHSSNAGFQAWESEFHSELVAAGLVQTADTGQLTPGSANRPGTNSNAGYRVYRFDDTLQGSAPIFLRFDFGTGSAAAEPRILVAIGTGSSGAGVITGEVMSEELTVNQPPLNTATPYPTYMNHAEGFLGIAFKAGGSNQGMGFLFVCRTTDPDTTPNVDGYFIAVKGGSTGAGGAGSDAFCGIWGGFTQTDSARNWAMVPFAVTASAVGADYQAYKVYGVFPETKVIPQLAVVVAAEIAVGVTTGAIELVTGEPHDYLSIGAAGSQCCVNAPTSGHTYNFVMLWD